MERVIEIEIQGDKNYGLLQDRYDINSQIKSLKKTKKITDKLNRDFKKEAEQSAYWSSTGKKELIIPARCIYACIMNGASFHKVAGRSAKSILAGTIRIVPDEIRLGTSKYEVHIVPVNNRSVGRVLKARPHIKNWKAKFQIIYDDNVIPNPDEIKPIIEEAGRRVGLLSWRPQKGGQYGTFKIVKWKIRGGKK